MDRLKTCAGCSRRSDRVTCQLVAFFTLQAKEEFPFWFEHDGNPQTYTVPAKIRGQAWAKHLDNRPGDADFQQRQLDLAHAAYNHLQDPQSDCSAFIAHDIRASVPEVDVTSVADLIWAGVTGGAA
jgi:hypothetical protein